MARQSGTYKISGTIDNLCFYKMDGDFYVRTKSSLTGKRVKQDIAFVGTMRYANLLASASKIASTIYQKLKPKQKVKGLYRQLTGKTMQRLKAGEDIAIVQASITADYLPQPIVRKKKYKKEKGKKVQHAFAEALLANLFADKLNLYAGIEDAVMMSDCPP